jgi:hypothetical protein
MTERLHRSPRPWRAALACTLVLAAVVAAGCSSDDSSSSGSKKSGGATTTTKVAPPSTVTDSAFDAAAATSDALIASAGTDPCAVLRSFGQASNLPSPINAHQTERGVAVVIKLFTAAADAAPPQSAADAATLRKAATDLQAEGAAANWDPEWLKKSPKAISDPAVRTAFNNYQTKVGTTCASSAPAPSTTAP